MDVTSPWSFGQPKISQIRMMVSYQTAIVPIAMSCRGTCFQSFTRTDFCLQQWQRRSSWFCRCKELGPDARCKATKRSKKLGSRLTAAELFREKRRRNSAPLIPVRKKRLTLCAWFEVVGRYLVNSKKSAPWDQASKLPQPKAYCEVPLILWRAVLASSCSCSYCALKHIGRNEGGHLSILTLCWLAHYRVLVRQHQFSLDSVAYFEW